MENTVCPQAEGEHCNITLQVSYFNTFHAAGVSRRQSLNVPKISKFCNLVTISWNHSEKCIQVSTNMPDICLEIG